MNRHFSHGGRKDHKDLIWIGHPFRRRPFLCVLCDLCVNSPMNRHFSHGGRKDHKDPIWIGHSPSVAVHSFAFLCDLRVNFPLKSEFSHGTKVDAYGVNPC